ncbi:MAG: phage holin family protein [Sporichthyaceae bacterium]
MNSVGTHRRSEVKDRIPEGRTPETQEKSLGELASSLSEQTSQLIRDEIALATREMQQKGKAAGLGIGLAGAGGVVALFGFGAVVTAAIAALAEGMDVWAAAAIVAVVLFALAAVMALVGKRKVADAIPPMPERAIAGVKADVTTIKESAHR